MAQYKVTYRPYFGLFRSQEQRDRHTKHRGGLPWNYDQSRVLSIPDEDIVLADDENNKEGRILWRPGVRKSPDLAFYLEPAKKEIVTKAPPAKTEEAKAKTEGKKSKKK